MNILQITWLLCLILFVVTIGMFSFEVDTPDGKIQFSGWVGKMFQWMKES